MLDRYEVLQRIGSGGMGAVYVGRQRAVDRRVALKVLRSDLLNNDHVRQRFRREAEIMAKLKHPNTVALIDYGETEDGYAVMVLELLEGQPLNDRLKEGPLPVGEALRVGEEIASSLAEAHLYGLVHRDLKPANIFLARSGPSVHAKVLDFGIARILDEEATRLTSTGQVFGTPRYMSPEQALSTGDVDAKSDLYSLGLIVYECVVGQPPFVAQTSIQYLSAHTTQTPPKLREALPSAPLALEVLIDACLSKSPEERPASAEEVGKALATIRRNLETGTGNDTVPVILRGNATQAPDKPTVGMEAPLSKAPPKKTPVIAIGLMILGLGAVFAAAGYMVLKPKDLDAIALDAGIAMAIVRDVGALKTEPDAAAPEEDAGGIEVAVADPQDAGLEPIEDPDDPPSKGRHPGKKKRDGGVKHQGAVTQPPPGNGMIVGPAGMVIETGDDEGVNLVKVAKTCKTSIYAGLGKITTQRCPADCAIIIDAQCGGLTPSEARAVPPGRRTISVVCGEKVIRTATVRIEAEEVTTFSCR